MPNTREPFLNEIALRGVAADQEKEIAACC
jgi:hypothetical protein